MKSKVVPVKNIARLMVATEALLQRSDNLPGMGCIHAPIGIGKSTATAWSVIRTNGVYVRGLSTSTPTDLLGTILKELKVEARGGCAHMTREAVKALVHSARPLYVDEVNILLESRRARELVELLRDLHDLSTIPVILVGDETMLPRLQRREQLFSRLAQIVEFKPLDREDIGKVAKELCDVEVADDLLDRIHQAPEIGGITRRVVVALSHIEQVGKHKGITRVSGADFGAKNLFTNEGGAR